MLFNCNFSKNRPKIFVIFSSLHFCHFTSLVCHQICKYLVQSTSTQLSNLLTVYKLYSYAFFNQLRFCLGKDDFLRQEGIKHKNFLSMATLSKTKQNE